MAEIRGVDEAVAEARKSMQRNGLTNLRYVDPQAVAAKAQGRMTMQQAMEQDAAKRRAIENDPAERAKIWLARFQNHHEMLRALGKLLILAESAADASETPQS